MLKELKNSIKNMFHFEGRIRRREFWVTWLWAISIFMLDFILALVPSCIQNAKGVTNQLSYTSITLLVILVFLGILIWVITLVISISIRRCHDVGFSAWTYLLCVLGGFFCGIGIIAWIVVCCLDSKDDNEWGPNPKRIEEYHSSGSIVLAGIVFMVSFFVFMAVCLLMPR